MFFEQKYASRVKDGNRIPRSLQEVVRQVAEVVAKFVEQVTVHQYSVTRFYRPLIRYVGCSDAH